VVGAGVGAVVGNKIGDNAVAGAAVGAVLGGLIGYDLDDKRCRLHNAQKNATNAGLTLEYKEIKEGLLLVDEKNTSSSDVGLQVSLTNDSVGKGSFESNNATLTPEAKKVYDEVASSYSLTAINQEIDDPKTTPIKKEALQKTRANREKLLQTNKIVIIGHSDDTGSSAKNAQLSEARAKTVAQVFKAQGVPEANIYYQGAGDVYPIADNRTPDGQAKNRRVEIVELPNDQSLATYLAKQPKKAEYYRPKTQQVQSNSSDSKTSSSSRAVAKQSEVIAKAPVTQASQGFDLGGVPLPMYKSQQNIGVLKQSVLASLSPIASANASGEYVYQSVCAVDQYREERAVKNLSNGGILSYMKSMTPLKEWQAKQSSYSASTDKAKVWLTAFDANNGYSGLSQTPSIKVKTVAITKDFSAKANIYESDSSVQYRVFFGENPADCMDVYFSKLGNGNPAYMVYKKSDGEYAVDMNFN
jgi:outer membrane protein OmpA-like peptidoglycan-associated protein